MNLERGQLGYRFDLEDRESLRNTGHEPAVLLAAAKAQLPKRNHIGKMFPDLTDPLDQGNQGACQGHALSLIFTICYYLMYGRILKFSRAAAYYLSQAKDGIRGDQGSTLAAGEQVARDGLCLEEDWPYPSHYDSRRPASATPDKFKYKLKSAKEFPKTEEGLKMMLDWLRTPLPVQIGIGWNNSCDREVVTSYNTRGFDGGHSTVFFLFKNENELDNNNSWGLWCDDGIQTWTMDAVRECFFEPTNVFKGYAPDELVCPDPEPIEI